MPNHIINQVRIKGMTLTDLNGIALNEDGVVDFELLLPIPLNYWQGDEGIEHQESFPGLGMRWSNDNWGTKWNAYGQRRHYYTHAVESDGDVILTFQTAWSFPRGWICALFNTVKKRIQCSWLDEGQIKSHSEIFTPADRHRAPEWNVKEFSEGSAEYRRMHKLLWGVEAFEDEDDYLTPTPAKG